MARCSSSTEVIGELCATPSCGALKAISMRSMPGGCGFSPSASTPPETNRAHCRQQGYTFTFLSDVNSQVIRAYDLVHKGGAPEGGDISRPAEFLIDRSGVVRWRNLTESVIVRARPEQLLAAIEDLRISTESKP